MSLQLFTVYVAFGHAYTQNLIHHNIWQKLNKR